MHVWMTAMLAAAVFSIQQGVPAATTPIARLAGQWTGSGVVNNATVSAKAEFGPVLANRFTRLTYVFTVAGVGDVFEGHAYYTCAKGADTCRGNWFDSQGSSHILTATQSGDTLTSEWGDGTTPRGRTEYRLVGAANLVVTDWVRTIAGEWRQFGRVEYRRQYS